MAKLTRRHRAPKSRRGPESDAWRFAHGSRTVADLIAPSAVEVARDHLHLDSQYVRTLVVTGYPRSVRPGWLNPLLDTDLPMELSVHLSPLETSQMLSALSHKLVQLHSSRLLAARSGRLADPEREIAYEDTERLRDALQRGEERIFAVSLYLLLRAPSLAELDALTRRVEGLLGGMLAQSRIALLEQDVGFHACLPAGQDRLLRSRNLDTTSLAMMFPFAGNALTMERGILYGIAIPSHTPVILDPFDASLENANLVIFAKSGAGKSYFTKLLAIRSLLAGTEFLVIDPEDEYRTLAAAVGGQAIRLASSSEQHLNPFDLPPVSDDERVDPLAEQVAEVIGLLEIMLAEPRQGLSMQERAVLDHACYQTYARAGIIADPASHERRVPLLRDLLDTLVTRQGDPVAASLAARLRRYVEGSLAGLFAGPTNVSLDGRVVVFNLQSLEPELRPLGIHLITSFVWHQVRRAQRPRLLIIDEAWSLLQYPEGGAFLASLARRARKYYLGLITITQDVADFLGAEQGRTVLTNAAMKLLMKQDSTTIEPVAAAFRLSPGERQFLLAAGKGEGLLFAHGSRLALTVEASPREHQLATTAPQELVELASQPTRRPPIAEHRDRRTGEGWAR
jgi:type IV secretory pathway VirB4 component